jgi:hypothetical protein
MMSDGLFSVSLPSALVDRAHAFRRAHAGATPGALSVEDVQELAELLTQAFATVGIQSTVVGGSALTLQVPVLTPSNDLDIVLEEPRSGCAPRTELVAAIMQGLGFTKEPGRHWSIGGCFVEFPGGSIEEPFDLIGAPEATLRVLSVEAMLVQRLVSYQGTGATAHGIQAALIIRAMGDRLDMTRFKPLALKEGIGRHYNAVRVLALGTPAVALDEPTLRDLYWALKPIRVTAAEAVATVTPTRVRPETPAPPALPDADVVPPPLSD